MSNSEFLIFNNLLLNYILHLYGTMPVSLKILPASLPTLDCSLRSLASKSHWSIVWKKQASKFDHFYRRHNFYIWHNIEWITLPPPNKIFVVITCSCKEVYPECASLGRGNNPLTKLIMLFVYLCVKTGSTAITCKQSQWSL